MKWFYSPILTETILESLKIFKGMLQDRRMQAWIDNPTHTIWGTWILLPLLKIPR